MIALKEICTPQDHCILIFSCDKSRDGYKKRASKIFRLLLRYQKVLTSTEWRS